jgi:hypothetical protein
MTSPLSPAGVPLSGSPIAWPASPSRKCLLLDDRFVADAWNVRRVGAVGKKHDGPVLPTPPQGPWGFLNYISVLRDTETGGYHLWYTLSNHEARARQNDARKAGQLDSFLKNATPMDSVTVVCYAKSADGIHWEKPDVGVGPLAGSNVVFTGKFGVTACCVMQGLFKNDPARKFTIFYGDWVRAGVGGHSYAHSPDGIHWTHDPKNHFVHGESDSCNNIIKNPYGPGYFLYERPWDCAAWGWVKGVNTRRRTAVAWSEDLYRWTEPENLMYPDELDDFEYYGMSTFYRDGVMFGMLSEFHPVNETMDIHLRFSRDGLRWDRLPDRCRLIERGPQGDFDADNIIPGFAPIEVDGDLRVYYTGRAALHNDHSIESQQNHGVGLITFPKARLIGRRGETGTSVLLSRVFTVDSDNLFIDAQTNPVGHVVIEIVTPDAIDPGGKTIPGFGRDDCDKFVGNNARHRVTWAGKNIASLKGKHVRLRIGLRQATVWSYEQA